MNTIKENSKGELIIKNSRFITILYKITDKSEIDKLLQEVKKEYPKANHYCYAYKIGEDIKKSSDDKEPSGTAGAPMLNILEKENITNVLAITIRYFGGIKLGASGLIRAYAKSVKEALNLTAKIELLPAFKIKITFPYEKENEIKKEIEEKNILKKRYLDKITYEAIIPKTSSLLQKEKIKILEPTYIEKS